MSDVPRYVMVSFDNISLFFCAPFVRIPLAMNFGAIISRQVRYRSDFFQGSIMHSGWHDGLFNFQLPLAMKCSFSYFILLFAFSASRLAFDSHAYNEAFLFDRLHAPVDKEPQWTLVPQLVNANNIVAVRKRKALLSLYYIYRAKYISAIECLVWHWFTNISHYRIGSTIWSYHMVSKAVARHSSQNHLFRCR